MSDDLEAKVEDIGEYSEMNKYAFVTQRAMDGDFVGYCYCEWSEIKIDSGWRFLFGDEDEDYLDNPDNSLTLDLSEVLKWKPELKEIIASRPNSEFEWNQETKQYIKI